MKAIVEVITHTNSLNKLTNSNELFSQVVILLKVIENSFYLVRGFRGGEETFILKLSNNRIP